MSAHSPGATHDPLVEVRRLRSAATHASDRADEARVLALDVDRRRLQILERDDDCLARHTAEVWSSRAAERSRTQLQRGVGYALWMVSEGLRETMRDLEAAAASSDVEATRLRRRATQLEDDVLREALTAGERCY